eukprot:852636-Heterocapsa_arctica.AAC.1
MEMACDLVGLTVTLPRLWSRIRAKLARTWEKANDEVFFWGGTGKPCDRAAWTHNLLAGYGKYANLEVATLFADIEKFYDHVSQKSLQEEGTEVGFPQLLMRALCGLYEGYRAIAYGTS